jgi:hypothetical protein
MKYSTIILQFHSFNLAEIQNNIIVFFRLLFWFAKIALSNLEKNKEKSDLFEFSSIDIYFDSV